MLIWFSKISKIIVIQMKQNQKYQKIHYKTFTELAISPNDEILIEKNLPFKESNNLFQICFVAFLNIEKVYI